MTENDKGLAGVVSEAPVARFPGEAVQDATDEPKVDRESAEVEFARFVDMMALDIDEATLDDEDKKGLFENKRRIINALMAGSLVVNDKGEPIFTPARDGSSSHNPIIFHEPTGSAVMEMDRKKDGHDIGKMVAVMANVTKTSAAKFAGLKYADLKVCMAIMMLYLG